MQQALGWLDQRRGLRRNSTRMNLVSSDQVIEGHECREIEGKEKKEDRSGFSYFVFWHSKDITV
jgi:hypothetical protein